MDERGGRSPRLRTVAVAILLAALTFGVFSAAIDGSFLDYDDTEYVTENPVVRAGLTWEGLRLAATRSYSANWHPVTWVSLMADAHFFGLDPRIFHLENVLLHTVNAVLLLVLLRGLTGALWPSLLVAALFALHPLRVESVAWVSERKDVLSAFFGLLAFLAYARYARRPSWPRYALTTLALALGLAAKPMLVTWPLLALVLDAWPLGRLRRCGAGRVLAEKIPWLLMSAAVSVFTFFAQGRGGAVVGSELGAPGSRLANALWASAAYLGKTLWPSGLSPFYPYRERGLLSAEVLGASLALALLSLLAAATARRRPWIAAGWCWYLIALAPVNGIVRIGAHDIADRYTYLPLVGPALALSWSVAAWAAGSARRRWAAAAASVAAALLLSAVTRSLIPHWRDSAALFTRMVEAVPGNPAGLYGLGWLRQKEGRVEEAERLFLSSLQSDPGYILSRVRLGVLYLQTGRLHEAEEHLRAAAALDPRDAMIQSLLGNLLLDSGRGGEAVVFLQAVVRLQPQVAEGFNNLGVALAGAGRRQEAAASFRRALELRKDFAEARFNLEAVTGSSPGQ